MDHKDKIKTFVTDAPILIVNEASTRDLRERVMKVYSDKPEDRAKIRVETETFRPNIIIDTKKPYEEDTFEQARIGNILIRFIGNCARCNAVTNNYETHQRNFEHEPYRTLSSYRKSKGDPVIKASTGILFGVYHQPDIIQSSQ